MIEISSIPTFCINLESRPDRWRSSRKELDRFGFCPVRIPAIKAQYPPEFDFSRRWSPGDLLTPGQEACMASHRLAWETAMQTNCDTFAFFEDDILFPSDFGDIFAEAYGELPDDWGVWHLHSFGPNQEATAARLKKYLTILSSNGYGSHGYLVKRDIVESVLLKFPSPNNEPVDLYLTLGMMQCGVKVYGVFNEHALCFQTAIDSNIIETSTGEYYKQMGKKYYR